MSKGYPDGSTGGPPTSVTDVDAGGVVTTAKPGVKTSEFKLAILTIVGSAAIGIAKVLGVAALASGQWWAIPASMALASAGYSISRGIAKHGGAVTVEGP